ncbi:glycosyltransferase family 2 protein [Aliikangiella maris]|uniref:Glycosyltransferase family 2 protein n=2 Tax=Aliikangiella maris TaxID=3162458 RepID=A0ABV2BRU4_9GAMM
MKQQSPRISIISVVYNGQKSIENCILSVAEQTYLNKEHIIIDGGSKDNTVTLIKKHEKKIASWISEPDLGIADAMNKGIKLASGEYLIFIHSDDLFLNNNSLEQAMYRINTSNWDLSLFAVCFGKNNILLNPKSTMFWINFKMLSCHQGIIYKRELFEKYGGYSLTYRICMDYEHMLRVYRKNIKIGCLSEVIAKMGDGGISSNKSWLFLRKRFLEEQSIHYKYCNSKSLFYIYHVYWPLYLSYRWLKNKLLNC